VGPGASLANNPQNSDVSIVAVGNGVVYIAGTFSVRAARRATGSRRSIRRRGRRRRGTGPGAGSVFRDPARVWTTIYVAAEGLD
jgi:hypothetical protein